MLSKIVVKMKYQLGILYFILSVTCFAQENSAVENALIKRFPQRESFTADGVWIYYPQDELKKINLPIIQKKFPGYDIYSVPMFYFIDQHSPNPQCVILYNEKIDDLIFVEPKEMEDLDQPFYKRLIGLKFHNINELKQFAKEFKSIFFFDTGIEVPKKVKVAKNKIGIVSIMETNNTLFRKIEIVLDSFVIKEIRQINPRNGEIEMLVN